MATLNASIINIANPILAAEFGVAMAQIQWVTTIYLIVTSAFMLMFGQLGDRVGAHKIYIMGIATFMVGSLTCVVVNGLILLLIGRAIQGLGAAMMVATSMGLIANIFPLRQRGTAMGINVTLVGLGNVAGPVVGGLVLANASWQAVFLVSMPFAFVSFIMAVLWLRSPIPKNIKGTVNIRGSLLFAGAITSLIIFLSGGFAGQEWFAFILLVFVLVFVLTERKEKTPLLDPVLLKNRRFMLGNLIAFLSYCAYMMLLFQLPFFLGTVWDIPVDAVGMLIMVSALCLAISGPIAGIVSDRFGALKVMPLALVAVVVCTIAAFFLSGDRAIGLFIFIMILAGLGMGFLNTPNNSDIMTAAGRERSSYASGFVGTNRNLAFCVGTALSASVFALGSTLTHTIPALAEMLAQDATLEYLASFRSVLSVCLLLVLVSLMICLYLKYSKKSEKDTIPSVQIRGQSMNLVTKDVPSTVPKAARATFDTLKKSIDLSEGTNE